MNDEPPLNFTVGKPSFGSAGEPAGFRALPPITGGTPEQIQEAEAIRAKILPEFDGAVARHAEMIANTFPDASPEGSTQMNSAAVAGIAEIRKRWLSQTSAVWWVKRRGQSPVHEIDQEVRASILAAAKASASSRGS